MSFNPKILVLEGDKPTLMLLESTLQRMGAEPRVFSSGREGILLAEREKFDGAFVDWDNLDIRGEEMVRRIRRSPANSQIPIAMFTASTDSGIVAKAFKSGVTLSLSKPFGPKELERLLNTSRGSMLAERRRHKRVLLSVPTVCEWGKKRGHKKISGRSVNVSSSGILMRLHPQPEAGTALLIELILPSAKKSLKLSGVVARTGAGHQVAVQFSKLTPALRDSLEDYVGSEDTQPVESAWIKS